MDGIPNTYYGKPLVYAWTYKDANGNILGIVGRYEGKDKKDVVPFFKRNGARWTVGAPQEPRPLYGLDVLATASKDGVILVVEGEKCAAPLQSVGFCTVTSLGGSKSADKSDLSPLTSFKYVLLLPDNDSPGQDYIRSVASILSTLNKSTGVGIIELQGLPKGGDIVDWIQARLPDWDGYSPVPEKDRKRIKDEFAKTVNESLTPVPEDWLNQENKTAGKDASSDHENSSQEIRENIVRKANDIVTDAKKDVGVPFEDGSLNVFATLRASYPAEWIRIRQKLKAINGVSVIELDKLTKPISGEDNEESVADRIVSMIRDRAELFHDSNDDAYCSFKQDGHIETFPIDSIGFRKKASHLFYNKEGKTPRKETINDAINTLSGIALYEGEEHKVWLRVAKTEEAYYLDLCDKDWRAIKIDAKDWCIVNNPLVRFRRTNTMQALPEPERGGDLNLLWDSINLLEEDRTLLLTAIMEMLRPDTPYPIIEFNGPQGSAKSSTQSCGRSVVDPSSSLLRPKPRNIEDIFVAAANNHVVSLNNLSHISQEQQDALCTLSTGGGYASRTLYTNLEETSVDVMRSVMLNGIPSLATNHDLLDRTIRFRLPEIPEDKRKNDAAAKAEFERNHASILGGLLNLFVATLKELPGIHLDRKPRMADFAELGEAVHKALGSSKSFVDLYRNRREAAILEALEGSPIATAIVQYLNNKPERKYKGSYKNLYSQLEEFKPAGSESWPRSPKGLSDIIRREEPGLRLLGIFVTRIEQRKEDGYHVVLTQTYTHSRENFYSETSTGSTGKDWNPEHPEHEFTEKKDTPRQRVFSDDEVEMF